MTRANSELTRGKPSGLGLTLVTPTLAEEERAVDDAAARQRGGAFRS